MKFVEKIKLIIRAGRIYLYDLKNDVRYSTLITSKSTQHEMLLSSLVVSAHTIEKGLTMPRKRYPFGEAKALEILSDCKRYVNLGYDVDDSRFIDVVNTMQEYLSVNLEQGWVTDRELDGYKELLDYLLLGKEKEEQLYSITCEEYFSCSSSDFATFSTTRHSCRNLPGHVNNNALKAALELSMNTPSTCNRQSQRIHLLQSEEAKKTILSIQSGNRGFGDIADQFILITSDLRCWPSMHQRNAPYVDGGIYLMNLLYCLHHEKIAACTLNLYLDKPRSIRLHRELSIPDNELPIALVAIGIPPKEFDLARSHRRDYQEVTFAH